MLVTLDPGITEAEVGQPPVLAIGHVETDIPGPAEHVAVLDLGLAEHTLALGVTKATGQLSRGLLNDAQHDQHITGLLRDGLQRHLDIAEQLGGVKTPDIPLQCVAVEGVTGLNRDLPRHHPFLGLADDGLTILIFPFAFFVEELHLNTSHLTLNHLQGDDSIGADPLWA